MKSNFTVKCPYCDKINDLSEDNWRDELVDDSQTHEIECLHCDYPMEITVNAIYTLSAKEIDEEEEERKREEHYNRIDIDW